jgi:hypothetical protein
LQLCIEQESRRAGEQGRRSAREQGSKTAREQRSSGAGDESTCTTTLGKVDAWSRLRRCGAK